MGWNSWNCWAGAVSDDKVRAAADAMVASGLAAHGFQYVNIDDCWEGERDAGARSKPTRVPRHAGPGRLRPFQGAEAGDLLFARPEDLRRLSRRAGSTSSRTPIRMPNGASITSSTTGAPTARSPAIPTLPPYKSPIA